ncbi:MAG: class II fructose-bisphosphatase [Thermaerobacter sp.]|nr:class II fructose-bisphosphatase [Thermaerobacter sp.]
MSEANGRMLQDYWADLLLVAEEAALAVLPHIGRGDKEAADQAAVDGMHHAFRGLPLSARVVIGEGEMDEAPMLFIGEELGRGGIKCDIAVDPLEGTGLTAYAQDGAMTVLSAGPADSLLHAPDIYMEKICAGPAAAGRLHIDVPLSENVKVLAAALHKKPGQLVAGVLDRPRHASAIAELRTLGVAVRLLSAGDVGPAVATCLPGGGVDLVVGTGGAPEGVLAACAVRALGGAFCGRLRPESDQERTRLKEMFGEDAERPLQLEDIVRSDDVVFAATSVTDSVCGPAPQRQDGGVWLSSLAIAGGKVRRVRRFVAIAEG